MVTNESLVLEGALKVCDVDRGEWSEDQLYLGDDHLEEVLLERLPWVEHWSKSDRFGRVLMGQTLARVRITVEVLEREADTGAQDG